MPPILGTEEPEDVLSASLGILYGYTAITHAEAGTAFTYIYPSDGRTDAESGASGGATPPLALALSTPDTRARNWALHASSVWAAAVFLANHVSMLGLDTHLRAEAADGAEVSAFEVLELGAGAGLPGLLVAKRLERASEVGTDGAGEREQGLGMKWRVTLSDYPDDLLIGTLRDNVRRNGFGDPETRGARVRVVPYVWGDDVSPILPSAPTPPSVSEGRGLGYDLILAADTLWNAALHGAFARTLARLLRRTPCARAHLVAGLHTGRYALCGFLAAVCTTGLGVLGVEEWEVEGSGERRAWAEEREGEDERERRRWVVWIVLGWVGE